MLSLENVIKANAESYYTNGTQTLSDDVFDAVVDKIHEENTESEILTTGWGYKVDTEDKVRHKYCHIGSLNKMKDVNDVKKHFGYCNIAISAKLDGLSCVLYFEKGHLIKAVTRGDGEYGLDITDKVKVIRGCPKTSIDSKFTGAVRGEIFMTPSEFKRFKKKYPNVKNARNSTAGIINQKELNEDFNYLDLFVYTVVASESTTKTTDVKVLYNFLKKNFEQIVPYIITENDSTLTYEYLESIKNEFEKQVTVDGLVLTSDFVPYDENTKCFKYDQVAFKFQDEIKITKVKFIEWTMSKHGAYIPVVVIEPIELEGTTVKRVTGYNAKWIKDMKIESDKYVAVRKSNCIIPQIMEVIG